MFERVKNLRDQFVIATDEEKEKINWLHATRYIAGIKYHYKEV